MFAGGRELLAPGAGEIVMFRDFKLRSFVSITSFLFFLLMAVSGLLAYIKPEGSVASWQAWSVFGLGKGAWEELHTLSAFFFLAFSVAHIVLNWKALCQYFSEKRFLSLELLAGALLLLAVLGGSIWRIPPFSLLMNAGEILSVSWESRGLPPFEKAERLPLREFCSSPEIGLELGTAESRLRKAGIDGFESSDTLEEIAGKYNTTPAELYKVITGEGTP